MNTIICGLGSHGKDTFVEELVRYSYLKFTSSSQFALDLFIWDTWGIKNYDTKEQCFNDRRNHRNVWFDLVSQYNMPNRARLISEIFKENDIYCGLRCKEELQEATSQGLVDLTIWVDASDRLPDEKDSSCTITPEMCDLVIGNNSDKSHLVRQAQSVAQMIDLREEFSCNSYPLTQ